MVCPKCNSTNIVINNSKGCCWDCSSFFDVIEEPEETPKRKIFLSYGHTEAEICRDIVAFLEKNGFEVWFDEHNIAVNDEWRRKIAEGIKSSNGVVACLSEHSVRNPGVCRDELRIALSLRGRTINTILMEDEDKVKPPAEVTHKQWLDMKNWKQMKAKSEEEYTRWFNDKASELLSVLNNEENVNFSGEITVIQDSLAPIVTESKYNVLLKKELYGRKWLTQEVGDWINSDSGHVMAIFGEPGAGKSAWSAHFCEFNPQVVGYFFCERNMRQFRSNIELVKSMAYQMACKIADYRKELVNILQELGNKANLCEAEDLLNATIIDPLVNRMVDGKREHVCIIIDGLDECEFDGQNAMAQFISSFCDKLPSWIKLIITSRAVSSVSNAIAFDNIISINESEENKSDIALLVSEKIKDEIIANAIVDRSEGVFMCAELLVHAYNNGQLTSVGEFPKGLESVIYNWFCRCFSLEQYNDKYRKLVGLLILSKDELPLIEMKRLGAVVDLNEARSFVRIMESFLAENMEYGGIESYRFSHSYLIEWLQTGAAGGYRIDLSDVIEDAADRITSYVREGNLSVFEAAKATRWLLESGNKSQAMEVFSDTYFLNKLAEVAEYFSEIQMRDRELECWEDLWTALTYPEIVVDEDRYALAFKVIAKRLTCLESYRRYVEAFNIAKLSLPWTKQYTELSNKEIKYNRGLMYLALHRLFKYLGNMDKAKESIDLYLKTTNEALEEECNATTLYEMVYAISNYIEFLQEVGAPLDRKIELYNEGIGHLDQLQEMGEQSEARRLELASTLIQYAMIGEVLQLESNAHTSYINIDSIYTRGFALLTDIAVSKKNTAQIVKNYMYYGQYVYGRDGDDRYLVQAYKIAHEAMEDNPSDANEAMLILTSRFISNAYVVSRKYEKAKQLIEQNLAIIKKHDLSSNGLIENRRGYAYALEDMADLAIVTGEEFWNLFKESYEIQLQLIKDFGLARDMDYLKESMERLQKKLVNNTTVIDLSLFMANAYYEIAQIHRTEQWYFDSVIQTSTYLRCCENIHLITDEMLPLIEREKEVCEALYKMNSEKYDEIYARSYEHMGDYCTKRGNKDLADGNYQWAMILYRECAKKNPQVRYYKEKIKEISSRCL